MVRFRPRRIGTLQALAFSPGRSRLIWSQKDGESSKNLIIDIDTSSMICSNNIANFKNIWNHHLVFCSISGFAFRSQGYAHGHVIPVRWFWSTSVIKTKKKGVPSWLNQINSHFFGMQQVWSWGKWMGLWAIFTNLNHDHHRFGTSGIIFGSQMGSTIASSTEKKEQAFPKQ